MNVLVLPGDGIGPEVTAAAVRVLHEVADVSVTEAPIGGASIDAHGVPVTDEVLRAACDADAVLLGAVGGPRWDGVAPDRRPERGLLALRSAMGVFANLRPARCFPGLDGPLRPEVAAEVDLVVVRELIGGIYFGERGLDADSGFDTMRYARHEVERIGRVAFEIAQGRSGRLMSVDKANVLASSRLWRSVMDELAAEYPTVALTHEYVDSAAMRLVTNPRSLDVVVTGNLFGDILSDEAAALTGSLGLLPSAALGGGRALYEPVHGSAPDIAGKGIANPLAAILSAAMLVRHTAQDAAAADAIEGAVTTALRDGCRSPDLGGAMDTRSMTEAVLSRIGRAAA